MTEAQLRISTADFGALNSATKYPSIQTYHTLDPSNGMLSEPAVVFDGPVVLTEKIDGTNGRIVLLPDGDFFIGSREELLYARGDRIINPAQGIVPVLLRLAEKAAQRSHPFTDAVWVLFLEVYGHRISGAAKQYTTAAGITGCRLFDVAWISGEVLSWPREKISSWREHGGQNFLKEHMLATTSEEENVMLTPRLGILPAEELPASLADTYIFLKQHAPGTCAPLDDSALGAAEGIVLRTQDRSVIAKARFQDYERTLRRKAQK